MSFSELATALGLSRALGKSVLTPLVPIPTPGRSCRIVGIDGLSGAGKSTFGVRLAAALQAPLLSTDDLVPGWTGLAESIALLAQWVLEPLTSGHDAQWRRHDWEHDRSGAWIAVPRCALLVVEGCGVSSEPAAPFLSYTIWLDAPAEERRRRLELREDWPSYAPHAEQWARQESAVHGLDAPWDSIDLVVDASDKAAVPDPDASFAYVDRAAPLTSLT